MWPFRNAAKTATKPAGEPSGIVLLASDTMHQRVEKAMRYAGFVNPNRVGSVDSIAFVMSEYERLFGATTSKQGGEGNG